MRFRHSRCFALEQVLNGFRFGLKMARPHNVSKNSNAEILNNKRKIIVLDTDINGNCF